MYINPFVFGVLATVGAEILALVVYCCYATSKRSKETREWKNQQKEEYKKQHE